MLARQSTNLRKLLFYPLLNSFVVLLKSSPKRFLRTKPHLVQQPTYRCFAEADAVLAPDQFAYHNRRPQCERKLHLSWVLHGHSIINPLQHLGSQFWRLAAGVRASRASQPPQRCRANQPNKVDLCTPSTCATTITGCPSWTADTPLFRNSVSSLYVSFRASFFLIPA